MIWFGLAAAFGAVFGLVVGHYVVQATPADPVPLSFWFANPIQFGHWKWALGGAVTGVVVRYFTVDD